MKAVVVTRPGGPEGMALGEAPDPAPGPHEVLVRVRAAGVNRADLLQRMGKYPPPPGASEILGLECAGEIVALGPDVQEWRLGDRVMAVVTGGAYAELCTVPESVAMPVPQGMSWEEAASIPEAFLTAWLNLFDLGGLESGQTVLVHAGASGVGSAAIQLAREAGIHALTTVGSEAKAEFVRKLGASRAILRTRDDYAAICHESTAGAGVDAVLDFVGAPNWDGNLRALRRGGRLLLIGFLGGSRGEVDLGPVLRKRLTVTGTTLRGSSLARKARWTRELAHFALDRFAAGTLNATVDRAFPLAKAAAAHVYMAENRNAGKIVLTMSW